MLRHSFAKFLLVGIVNTIVGLSAMYLCLNFFALSYWVSTFSGNAIGALVSYFLNKRLTFQSSVPMGASMAKFIIVILGCYFFSYKLGLDLTQLILHNTEILPSTYIDEMAVLVGSGLYTVTNYMGQRFFVFTHKKLVTSRE